MKSKEELFEKKKFKVDARNRIDVALLGISITLFALVATLKPEMLSEPFLTLQLVLSIPFFVCGLFARVKEAAYFDSNRWEKLNFISFTLAYGFFINSIGLILSLITPLYAVITFFAVNTILTLVRSGIVISYNPNKLKSRIFRESLHIGLIVFLGVLPVLKVY